MADQTPRDVRAALANRVRERLADLGVAAEKVSHEMGMGDDYVRNILRGAIRNPSLDALADLAKALKCTIGDLLDPEPAAALLPVVMELRAGVFVEPAALRWTPYPSHFAPLQGIEGEQWAALVGDSALMALSPPVPPGSCLHVIAATAAPAGALAVVARERAGLVERVAQVMPAAPEPGVRILGRVAAIHYGGARL